MIFRNRSPKGIFGQNMSDLPNGLLTDGSRSLQSAVLKHFLTPFLRSVGCRPWKNEVDMFVIYSGLFMTFVFELQ